MTKYGQFDYIMCINRNILQLYLLLYIKKEYNPRHTPKMQITKPTI